MSKSWWGLLFGMDEMGALLERWRIDEAEARRRMYRAPTPRERERWHAPWLLAQGWTAAAVARALDRDAHTIGQWATAFAEGGPRALSFEQSGGSPRAERGSAGRIEGGGAGVAIVSRHRPIELELEGGAAIYVVPLRVVAEPERLSELPPSTRGQALHRLGYVLKRPKKRLRKADPVRREAFVGEYAALTAAARRAGVKIFFADEAHFRADGDLRGKWVLKGEPALVDSTSPRRGEKASYYSAACLETGEVEMMELAGNSNSATSADFLRQLRARHTEPLTVIWDNSPAHRGDALRAYLTTPGMNLCLVNLSSYSPDFNADEAVWGWVRQEVTANLCLGTRAAVQEKVGDFFANLASRRDEVKRRCRTVLQARVAELSGSAHADFTALQM